MALAAVALTLASIPVALAQDAPSPTAPQAPALTIPGQHARANGVVTCLPVIEGVARQVIADAPANAQSVWHAKDPDKRLFMSAIAADRAPAMAFVTAAPDEAGACDSTAVQISYVAESCLGLRAGGLAGLQPTWQTGSVAAFLHPTGAAYYLMQAGTGCLVAIQEVRFLENAAGAAAGVITDAPAPRQ